MMTEPKWSCPNCRDNILLTLLEIAEIEALISEAQVLVAEGKGPASPGMFLERIQEILNATKERHTAR